MFQVNAEGGAYISIRSGERCESDRKSTSLENPGPSQFNTIAVAEGVQGYTSSTGRATPHVSARNPGPQRCVMKGLWKQELKGRSLCKIMALHSCGALGFPKDI